MLAPEVENKLTPRQYLVVNLFLGLVICAGALVLFYILATAIAGNGEILRIDQNVAAGLNRQATPTIAKIMLAISLFGLQILWVILVVVALFLGYKRRWSYLIAWLGSWLGAELLTQVLKLLFHRPRPIVANPLLVAAEFSFPSGHATISLVVYGMLAFFILLNLRSAVYKSLVLVAAVLLVTLIGISRLYLGVHYFSDVAAGYIVGAIWLTICINSMNVLIVWRGKRVAAVESDDRVG